MIAAVQPAIAAQIAILLSNGMTSDTSANIGKKVFNQGFNGF